MSNEYVNLLLIDDDDTLLNTASMMLKSMGYAVETAKDAASGLKLLAEDSRRFSLVLTDYSMPDMDGRELVRRARKLGDMPPFVVITGYVLDGDDLGDEFVGMLLKPFRMRALKDTIEEFVPSPS
jgi:CheY-like chemotaxis protein